MLKVIRIKKGDFYVANSETVGDIFEDNDQVMCEFALPHPFMVNNQKNVKKSRNKKPSVTVV